MTAETHLPAPDDHGTDAAHAGGPVGAAASPKIDAHQSGASEGYGEGAITILEGLEAVRKRPGMYIGDTSDGNSSALFTIPDNTTFKYVVMPMRI